jgi:AcrR family transcriptional regulator
MQRTRRSVDERRAQLVDTTLEILASEGLGAATTRRITEEAGLALGAFHYAFRSKDELLRAVIERLTGQISAALAGAVDSTRDDLSSAVESIIRGLWAYVERHPDEQLAHYELTVHALRDETLRELAGWQYDQYTGVVVDALEGVEGAPTGQERTELARFLVATLDGLILHHCVQGDLEAARRRLEQCVSSARTSDWRDLVLQSATAN